MKLTPSQIGKISQYIEESVKLYPEEHKTVIFGKSSWEEYIEQKMNGDKELGVTYDEFVENHRGIFEALIDYFTK